MLMQVKTPHRHKYVPCRYWHTWGDWCYCSWMVFLSHTHSHFQISLLFYLYLYSTPAARFTHFSLSEGHRPLKTSHLSQFSIYLVSWAQKTSEERVFIKQETYLQKFDRHDEMRWKHREVRKHGAPSCASPNARKENSGGECLFLLLFQDKPHTMIFSFSIFLAV